MLTTRVKGNKNKIKYIVQILHCDINRKLKRDTCCITEQQQTKQRKATWKAHTRVQFLSTNENGKSKLSLVKYCDSPQYSNFFIRLHK